MLVSVVLIGKAELKCQTFFINVRCYSDNHLTHIASLNGLPVILSHGTFISVILSHGNCNSSLNINLTPMLIYLNAYLRWGYVTKLLSQIYHVTWLLASLSMP